jgi:hypothetical protein
VTLSIMCILHAMACLRQQITIRVTVKCALKQVRVGGFGPFPRPLSAISRRSAVATEVTVAMMPKRVPRNRCDWLKLQTTFQQLTQQAAFAALPLQASVAYCIVIAMRCKLCFAPIVQHLHRFVAPMRIRPSDQDVGR